MNGIEQETAVLRGGPHDGAEQRIAGLWVECGGHIWPDRRPTTCQYSWQEDEDGTFYGKYEHQFISGTTEIA